MAEDMSLQEHMAMLGLKPSLLAFSAKLPVAVVQRALAGQAITRLHAESLCYALSEEHGLKHVAGYKPEDIKNLRVYDPPPKNSAERPNALRDQLRGK